MMQSHLLHFDLLQSRVEVGKQRDPANRLWFPRSQPDTESPRCAVLGVIAAVILHRKRYSALQGGKLEYTLKKKNKTKEV